MSDTTSHRLSRIADLAAVVAVVAAFGAVVLAGVESVPLRLLVGLPALLFAPGYLLTVALYPRAAGPTGGQRPRGAADAAGRSSRSIGAVSRLVLAVVTSVAIVATVGALVNASPWLLRPTPLVATLFAVVLATAAAAAYRRTAVPVDRRYRLALPWRSVVGAFRPRLSVTFLLGIALVASVLGATAVIGTSAPASGQTFSGLGVYTENASGEYVAGNYSAAVAAGEPLSVSVANDEGDATDYTVVLVRETVGTEGSEMVVTSATEQARERLTVPAGEAVVFDYEPEPTETDRPQRLHVYLYRGDAPELPGAASAYHSARVWYHPDPAEALNATAG